MNNFNYEDWVAKCNECAHSYKRKDDDETMYCRLRRGICEFKAVSAKEMKEAKNGY